MCSKAFKSEDVLMFTGIVYSLWKFSIIVEISAAFLRDAIEIQELSISNSSFRSK